VAAKNQRDIADDRGFVIGLDGPAAANLDGGARPFRPFTPGQISDGEEG
jgi:hypothetical protein